VGDAERGRALATLRRAASEGRFAGSARYEELVQRADGAKTAADLGAVELEARRLVPERARIRLLRVIARAHAAGRLDFEEFLHRSDRVQAPLSYEQAATLLADLGVVVRPSRALRPTRGRARKLLCPAAFGGAAGSVLVAVPVLAAFPDQFVSWLPVVLGTGAFSAAGTAAVAVALPLRRQFLMADRPERPESR
jgi:hypothetical protein